MAPLHATIGVLLLGLTGVLATDILRYTETEHSRTEMGVPGTNVSGRWSWVDSDGDQHDIWYIADTEGFRAFGDTIPEALPASVVIGTPVVVGSAAPTASGPSLQLGAAALPQTLLRGSAPTLFPRLGTHAHAAVSAKQPPQRPALKAESSKESDIIAAAASSGNLPAHPRPTSLFVLSDSSLNSPLTINAAPQAERPNKATDSASESVNTGAAQPPKMTRVSPSENIVNRGLNKVAVVMAAIGGIPPNAQEKQQQSGGMHMEPLLGPVLGSNFVIIDKLRVPNNPKPRVGSQTIVPQPVPVKGQPPPVILGLHTSGRPPMQDRLKQGSRPLQPLGIHLLNFAPARGSSKSLISNGPVPRPIRVVGAPNLENFYRPAQLARTTPSPFRLPRPMKDYDYQYYDYQYYDYAEPISEAHVNGPNSTSRTNKKSQNNSDENSAEPDFPDSDENDD